MGIEAYQIPAYDFAPMKASTYGLNQFRSYETNFNSGYNCSNANSYQVNNCERYS